VGGCEGQVMVFVETMREILGGCVEEGHFLAFVDGVFFLRPIQNG
jgi:hypothetical protein